MAQQSSTMAVTAQTEARVVTTGPRATSDDENVGAGDEFMALQLALQKVIKSKKDKSQGRMVSMLAELQQNADAQLKALKAAAAKENKEAVTLCKQQVDALEGRLSETFQAVEALAAKFQQDVAAKWEEYNTAYSGLEALQQRCSFMVQKKGAAHKRKLEQLKQDFAGQLQEADAKLAKHKSQAYKLPDLANFLKHLV